MKATIRLSVVSATESGHFTFEYKTTADAKFALQRALPMLASVGTFQADQLNFDLQLAGIPIEQDNQTLKS